MVDFKMCCYMWFLFYQSVTRTVYTL